MTITGDMLRTVDDVLFVYASMTHTERMTDTGTLAKLAINKFGKPETKARLRMWVDTKDQRFGTPKREAIEHNGEVPAFAGSRSGYSKEPGAEGPGVVAEH